MQIVHLRAGGCSLVLGADGSRLPSVLHWGAELEDLSPEAADGLDPEQALLLRLEAAPR